MSFRRMVRQCTYCHHIYPYNPSTGNLGLTCKHCGKAQPLLPIPSRDPQAHIIQSIPARKSRPLL